MLLPDPQTTDPAAASARAERDWRDAMRTGAQRMQAGDAQAAIVHFQHAVALRPDHQTTGLNLAAAQWRAGEHEPALRSYERVLVHHPGCAAAHHGRGLALHGLHDRAGALAAFRAAVQYQPDADASWGSIADLTTDEDERCRAIVQVAAVLDRRCQAPDAPAALRAACVSALIDARHYPDALRFIREQRAHFPDATAAADALARTCYRMGRFPAAFRYKRQALRGLDLRVRPPPRAHRFNTETAVAALREVIGLLEAQGAEPFLAAGTLLGFYREGGPLPHDRDVDIGVIRAPGSTPDIVALIRDHPQLLLRRDHRPGDRYVALTHRGIGIDVFVHDADDAGYLRCGVSDHPGDIQWRFSPFTLADAHYQGRHWRIPQQPERYLTESYGPQWRQPDTGFASAIRSPALYQVDRHARAYYAAARAQHAWLAGDADKACALLRQSPIPLRDIALAMDEACPAPDPPTTEA